MDGNVVEHDVTEEAGRERCVCHGGVRGPGAASLEVLQDVQRAYEQRMELLERAPAASRLQLQVDVLRSWVSDLVGQNTLLVRAVEELETEATTRLFLEQRKHSEMVCELRAELAVLRQRAAHKDSDLRGLVEVLRRLRDFDYCSIDGIHFYEKEKRNTCGKVNELKVLNESLHKENVSKDREIRKLHKDAQQYEQTIMNLRSEISLSKYHTPDVTKKDAESMAGMCCTRAECGDWKPVKDFNSILREEMISYQDRIQKMETNLKDHVPESSDIGNNINPYASSGEDARTLRRLNVGLREELHAVHGVCTALGEQCRAGAVREQFKDKIIHEMRRQLKQAKAKSKDAAELLSNQSRTQSQAREQYNSLTIACVRQQPRRARDAAGATARSLSGGDGRSPRLVLSGDNLSADADSMPRSCERDDSSTQNILIESQVINLMAEMYSKTCECTCDVMTSTVGPTTSTPNASRDRLVDDGQSSVSIIENPEQTIIQIRDSIEEFEETLTQPSKSCSTDAFKRTCQCKMKRPAGSSTGALESGSGTELRKRPCPCKKIKPEPKVVSFDDDAQESVGRSSASPSSSCASARAHYYQNKLLATLQVLQNKEETVRVQSESLAVAEARIASLTARGAELKREIERKGREIQTLRKTLEERKVEKTDACITADIQEMDSQGNIVITLQNNLGVIEDLYRECFYETVKQENLIEMLRKSYLDVRLMDKEKSDRISKLHNVINTQKWSLDRCQDIAAEVDNLKVEISNFMNSSNNDSGMWEESVAGGIGEDLQDIAAQLLKLRDMLTGDCTCGLKEENLSLKLEKDDLEIKVGDLHTKISDLETNLKNKDLIDIQCQEQIAIKERELHSIREQITALVQTTKDQTSSCDMLSLHLSQTQAQLKDKCTELSNARAQCEAYEGAIRSLTEHISKTGQINKENVSLRSQLCAAMQRAARLEDQAARAEHAAAGLRDKAGSVVVLKQQLRAAHERGAEMCGEARRIVCAVRGWARRARAVHREQEEQIKQKETELRLLEERLEQNQKDIAPRICHREQNCSARPSTSFLTTGKGQRYPAATRTSETEATCSKFLSRRSLVSFASDCGCERQEAAGTSASERCSCESTPVPPKRTQKKKTSPFPIMARYGWRGPFAAVQRDAAAQQPLRCDAASSPPPPAPRACCPPPPCRDCPRGAASPCEDVLCRVEALGAALGDSCRRWARRAGPGGAGGNTNWD